METHGKGIAITRRIGSNQSVHSSEINFLFARSLSFSLLSIGIGSDCLSPTFWLPILANLEPDENFPVAADGNERQATFVADSFGTQFVGSTSVWMAAVSAD